ncbi:MAG: ABC transporter permease [Dehalococcoidia bacterium]|nr:ABC transporter permease [Dehalococcoidia bacterium]
MKIWDCFSTALRTLFSHKMRSILTMLGILIGVAAVISMVSLVRAEQDMVRESFESLGTNLVMVLPGAPSTMMGIGGPLGSAQTLTLEDAEAIASNAPSVAMVAPVVQTSGQIVAGGENLGARISGVTPEYQYVSNLTLAEGSFITKQDYRGRSRVVVLGSELAGNLFGLRSPVGEAVRIDGRQFRVIGVLESKGTAFGNEDLMAYAPLSTVQSTLTVQRTSSIGHTIQAISIQAKSKEQIDSAKWEISNILRQRHHIREGEDDDFTVMSMDAILSAADQMYVIGQLIMGAIAGISLLVGGIGIMNIMLVSVTERTREIGLRKAVGAKRRDILTQFLIEAAVLSSCGGAIGVLLGWFIVKIASDAVANMGFPFPAVVPGDVIALAVGVAVFVGLASGLYPAVRAARLDPIESLRHE